MKNYLVIVLSVILSVSICGCAISRPKMEILAEKSWEAYGESTVPKNVFVINYSDRDKLSDEDIEEGLLKTTIESIPESGICILFGAPEGGYGFDGLHAIFYNNDEQFAFEFDYRARYLDYLDEDVKQSYSSIYDTTHIHNAIDYLNECNWFSGMYNYANGSSFDSNRREITDSLDKNKWYSFSEKQKENVVKKQ